MTDFDPAAHRMVPQQRWFEIFVLRERFVIPARTMTTACSRRFQTAIRDTHPVPYDVDLPCPLQCEPARACFQTLIPTAPVSRTFPF